MKLLFDQNLSHRLVAAVSSLCPGSAHVREIGLQSADDAAIWHHALEHGFCIVTRDTDFLEQAMIKGTPPAVVCLRGGNTSTERTRRSLMAALPGFLRSAAESPPPHVLELIG